MARCQSVGPQRSPASPAAAALQTVLALLSAGLAKLTCNATGSSCTRQCVGLVLR